MANEGKTGVNENDVKELQKYADSKYSEENYSDTIGEVPPLIQRGTVYLILIAIIVTSAILYFGKVGLIVSAKGKIVTEEGDYAIKAFEGGEVIEILAKEGDMLKKGDPIIIIEPEDEIQNNLAISQERIKVLNREKALLKEQVARDKVELENKKKRFDDFTTLYKKGLISKIEYDNERERIWNAEFSIKSKNKQIKEKELQILTEQISLKETEDRTQYTRILMPVDGKVIKMNVNHEGQMINRNYDIALVQPDNSPLVIEAYIENKDIAFIVEGQEVQIKVDAFPFQQFGTINGKVKTILPDLTSGAKFKINIELLKDYFDVNDKRMQVFAGLTVVTEIVTGEQRLFNMILNSGSEEDAESNGK